jgi:hypothetical protein
MCSLGMATVAGIVGWFVWKSVLAVIIAVIAAGVALLIVGTIVMSISMMRTRYPLQPPDVAESSK